MALFFYYKDATKQTVREASHSTTTDVLEVWAKARIPTRLKKHVVDKIEYLFREYDKLKKNKENKAKRSESLQKKEENWKDDLEGLFDIAHANAMNMISIQEDREFLLAQREVGRRGKMGSVDKVLTKRERDAYKKEEDFKRRREKEEQNRLAREEKVILQTSSESEQESDTGDEAFGAVGGQPSAASSSTSKRSKRGTTNILDDKLAVCLDMAKVSDRNAALVLTPALQHLGHDPAEFNVNRSSIRRERMKRRQKIAESLRAEFKPTVPLTIHWDGKLLEDISSKEIVDRLPILVSGQGVDQLLCVPKLPSGTGEAAAAAVYEATVAWNIADKIKCLCFDTTSVNSGPRNGACILLEQKLDKDLLWFACRHHMLEIVLEAVVTLSLGPSKGPDIMIFKRFQANWEFIDRSRFQTSSSDEIVYKAVSKVASEITAFAETQLQQFQPRDDYRELLELTIMFLGGVPSRGCSFKAPAGLHRARWMAKAIYSLKIWMLRSQFKMTKREEKGIADVCLFTVILYIKAWFRAPSAPSAPRVDLDLIKEIDKYKEQNQAVSQIAMKKILGHLWYLSEELIALAFFDDEVTDDTKRLMVNALRVPGTEHPLKRIVVDPTLVSIKNLQDFVTESSRRFFTITGLPSTFIDKDVALWSADADYQSVKNTVSHMRVVNDIAERGVALMDEYNKLHTNDEEQKQFLLLTVKEYRQRYPDRSKKTLAMD